MTTITVFNGYQYSLAKLNANNLLNGSYYQGGPNYYLVEYDGGVKDYFWGFGFTYDANLTPLTGTVTGYRHGWVGTPLLMISNIAVSAVSIVNAAFTTSTVDDQALYRAMLQGNDIITGDAADDTIEGFEGADTLAGGDGRDTLVGGDGNDTLIGGAGADRLNGGGGIDTANYARSTAAVAVNLATGAASGGDATGDTVTGIENVIGSAQSDTLTGNAGNNLLNGGIGSDMLAGGGGNDSLVGGDGNDTLIGGGGADALEGGAGIDAASYTGSNAGVTVNLAATGPASGGHAAGDTFAGIENLIGSANADSLTGGAGNNVLSGGAGNDTLAGRLGNDMLAGGVGADTFDFNTALGAANVDRITDFSAADDTIRLENAIFTALTITGALSVSAFAIGAAAGDANDRIIYDSTSGVLYYDADGTGVIGKVQFAQLTTHPSVVTNADFLVI
jgi:serralysin